MQVVSSGGPGRRPARVASVAETIHCLSEYATRNKPRGWSRRDARGARIDRTTHGGSLELLAYTDHLGPIHFRVGRARAEAEKAPRDRGARRSIARAPRPGFAILGEGDAQLVGARARSYPEDARTPIVCQTPRAGLALVHEAITQLGGETDKEAPARTFARLIGASPPDEFAELVADGRERLLQQIPDERDRLIAHWFDCGMSATWIQKRIFIPLARIHAAYKPIQDSWRAFVADGGPR